MVCSPCPFGSTGKDGYQSYRVPCLVHVMKEHSPWEVEHRGSTLPRCPLIQQCQNQNVRSRGPPGHPDRIHTKRLLTVVQAVWYKIRQAVYRGVGSRGARHRSTRGSTRGPADDAGEPGVLDGRHVEHDCQLHEEQRGIGARWHGGTQGSVAVEESPPGAGPARDAGMGSISRGETRYRSTGTDRCCYS